MNFIQQCKYKIITSISLYIVNFKLLEVANLELNRIYHNFSKIFKIFFTYNIYCKLFETINLYQDHLERIQYAFATTIHVSLLKMAYEFTYKIVESLHVEKVISIYIIVEIPNTKLSKENKK